MTPQKALEEIRHLVDVALHPAAPRGSWFTLLHIRRLLDQAPKQPQLSAEEARHLAAIIPAVGSTAVDIGELDWFEVHGQELAEKLEAW